MPMLTFSLHSIFQSCQTPIIVCRNAARYPVVYANYSASLLFYQQIQNYGVDTEQNKVFLDELFGSSYRQTMLTVVNGILQEGKAEPFPGDFQPAGRDPVLSIISGNRIDYQQEDMFIIYFDEYWDNRMLCEESRSAITANAVISTVLKEAFQTVDPNEAISRALSIMGQYVDVSRAYIFEDLNTEYTGNTYEWCNTDVEPAIQDLSLLKKSDYNYEQIVSAGKFIYNDIQEIPDGWGREILEAQGIKAIAILALLQGERTIGYVGFDNCKQTHRGTEYEIQALEQVANILVSLINRRDVLREEKKNLEVLKTVSDNFDQVVYASDIQTDRVLFVNRVLAELLGKSLDQVIGRPCWEVLQGNPTRCDFCPLPKMVDKDGAILKREYIWERENTNHNRWYQVKDLIIKWFDGRDVHLEIATDITNQKKYEKKLRDSASTDALTGLLNRKWGGEEIALAVEQRKTDEPMSICFVDLDGLKYVNDTYGHDMGDDMLIATVGIIQASIRKSDIICRWGGDEFVLLMRCDLQRAQNLMERIQANMDEENRRKRVPYQLAFSYGLASVEENTERTVDDLIGVADGKMYEQKLGKRTNRS